MIGIQYPPPECIHLCGVFNLKCLTELHMAEKESPYVLTQDGYSVADTVAMNIAAGLTLDKSLVRLHLKLTHSGMANILSSVLQHNTTLVHLKLSNDV